MHLADCMWKKAKSFVNYFSLSFSFSCDNNKLATVYHYEYVLCKKRLSIIYLSLAVA